MQPKPHSSHILPELLSLALLLVLCITATAQFTNVSDLLNISTSVPTTYNGNGISFYDFNNDGWDDITIARGNTDPVFLMNDEGTFTQAEFSIPNTGGQQINMILWADYNSDGYPDLLITKYDGPLELWQNDGEFNFTNVTEASGLNTGNYRYVGAAYADFDHDGDLDLYIAKFYHPAIYTTSEYAGEFYINNGDGTFTESTVEAGVYVNPRAIFQPVFLDFDGDGWEDLYLITDRIFSENALFKNNGDGTFTNVSTGSGADIMIDSMTGTVGDYDNDGDLDIYITNSPPAGSKFLENNGDETFTEVAAAMGVNVTQIGWGSLWIDYDNDSWQDLFVSLTQGVQNFPGNYFYRNNEGNSFTNLAVELGLRDEITETYVCAGGDSNNDGYFDILLNNKHGYLPKLYQNDGGENNYLSLSLRGVISNRDGTGSWIRCYADGNQYVRYTLCGENLIGQNANRYIFGLGQTAMVDSLVIEWNMGTRDVYYDLDTDQHIYAVEGITAYDTLSIISDGAYICENGERILSIGLFDGYLWNTGDESPEITIDAPGTYSVQVLVPGGVWVDVNPILVLPAPEFSFGAIIDHETCHAAGDGSIALDLEEGSYLSVLWDDNSTGINLENLAPGEYSVLVADTIGCMHSQTFVVQPALPFSIVASVDDVLCFGDSTGQAEVLVFGGTPPHALDWQGADPMALPSGEIPLFIYDINGCDTLTHITIESPDSIAISLMITNATSENTGSADASISGGLPPYQITWSAGQPNGNQVAGLEAGTHWIAVTDANDCMKTRSFSIEQMLDVHRTAHSRDVFLIPNPASDDIFLINLPASAVTAAIRIFDLTGKTCLTITNHLSEKPIDVSHLNPGIYMVQVYSSDFSATLRLVKL